MYIQYGNEIFNASVFDADAGVIEIWRHTHFSTSSIAFTKKGTMYERKLIAVDNYLDKVYSAIYYVNYLGEWLSVSSIEKIDEDYFATVVCDNQSFAVQHNFTEFEEDRGEIISWTAKLNLKDVDGYTCATHYLSNKRMDIVFPSVKQFIADYDNTVVINN